MEKRKFTRLGKGKRYKADWSELKVIRDLDTGVYYTGGVFGIKLKANDILAQKPDGKLVIVRYFPRYDTELVIAEED
jgi:hypothetical protein